MTSFFRRALCAGLLTLAPAALAPSATAQAPPAQVKLLPADGAVNEQYGQAVAIDGDYAVVGAPNDGGSGRGAAYVFVRSGGAWAQQAKLVASDGANGDAFGSDVDIHGDRLVVGAYLDDAPARPEAGSAYVFSRSGTAWTQEGKLNLPINVAMPNDHFGSSVGIFGTRVIIGAPNKGTSSAPTRGEAFLFGLNSAGTWAQTTFVGQLGSDTGSGDRYGTAVSMSADRILIGAPFHQDGTRTPGSVYDYRLSGTTWVTGGQVSISGGPPNGARFGSALDIDGARAIVGAPGVTRNGGAFSGSAYTYVQAAGGTWLNSGEIEEPTASAAIRFGGSVDLSGIHAVIGTEAGVAYVYDTEVPSAPRRTPVSADAAASDGFGRAVALDGDDALIGAPFSDQPASNSGAAYVFDVNPTRIDDFHNPTAAQGDGAGWRLLGAPVPGLTVSDLAALNLVQGLPGQYPGATPILFTDYDGAAQTAAASTSETLTLGQGFMWYLFDSDLDGSATPNGTSNGYELTDFALRTDRAPARFVVSTTFADNTDPGDDDFQMLANPYTLPLLVSGISASSGIIQSGDVFHAYDPALPGYVTLSGTDVLSVWQGVFAELVPTNVGSGVRVQYRYNDRQPGTAPFYGRTGDAAVAPAVGFTLTGTLAGGARVGDAAAVVRFRDDALAAWDAWDASKPGSPTAEVALLAPVLMRDGAATRVAVDTRPTNTVATVPLALRTTDGGTFSLSWTDDLPDGWTATLADDVTGETVDVRTADGYAFTADGATAWAERFTVTVTPAGIVSSETETQTDFELSAPAPNPVRTRTRMQLAVGTPQAIRATLHDALGRTVAVLHDADTSGTVSLTVDATDLAAGVYVVRVEGDTVSATRRLTVVR